MFSYLSQPGYTDNTLILSYCFSSHTNEEMVASFFFLSFYFVLRGEVGYWIDTVLNKLGGKYQGKIRKEFETGESAH